MAIILIYQAGQKDVTAVELWQADCQEWRGMRKAYGGVWDMPNPPVGALNLRFQVNGEQWIQVSNAIPCPWKAGFAYDSTIQLY
ncbi:expansin C-terminal domain-related protein [Bacillus cereus]|uniref:expansin C-terminal domain-related protein n=1 Tax=Bacillus cereus TaxID=1396 RepID=UPI00345C447E